MQGGTGRSSVSPAVASCLFGKQAWLLKAECPRQEMDQNTGRIRFAAPPVSGNFTTAGSRGTCGILAKSSCAKLGHSRAVTTPAQHASISKLENCAARLLPARMSSPSPSMRQTEVGPTYMKRWHADTQHAGALKP